MFSQKNFLVASLLVAATIGGAMSFATSAQAADKHWTIQMRQDKLMQDINLAQKQHQLTEKEAKKLRSDLSDVARLKRDYRKEHINNDEHLTPENKKELEEKLNDISAKIKKLQLDKLAK
ncbi:MAG TPA: hypothetical protein V6C76_00260 [Drouetiella sp.]